MTGTLLEFPPRYTAETLDYAFTLVDSAVEPWAITSATVELAEGNLTISDVDWNEDTVTFRMAGGTSVYQRVVCKITIDSTPPNIYELQATIACSP